MPVRGVIFGHTHRAGPLPGDDAEWTVGSGATLDQQWLLGARTGLPRPLAGHQPLPRGFAVRVEADGGEPELFNLLD